MPVTARSRRHIRRAKSPLARQFIKRTDAAGNTRGYSYNAAGQITQEEHKLNGTTLDQSVTYSYDADGQLTAYEQKDGAGQLISSASYARDEQGRTAQSAITYGKVDGGSFSFTIGQSFNADGKLASHTYPDGSQQTYSYSQDRLTKVTLPNGSQINYGNYNWQTATSIQTPGATKTVSVDALQRPTKIEVRNAATQLLASRAYQYDAAGNITQIDSDLGQTKYSYDQLDRLTKASPDAALQALGLPQEQYSYDPVGNRTTSAHQGGIWKYNQDNQLTQYPWLKPFSGVAIATETQVSYTPQGHTAKETNIQGEQSYGYNVAERLIKYTSVLDGHPTAGTEASYRYDPLGRRISKSVRQGNSTTTTYFQYGEHGLMAETDQTGKITKAYGFNPQSAQRALWSTDPIWQADASNGSLTNANTSFAYLHTDQLGTPVLATTKEGSTSWKAVSEAFGATSTLPESSITMNLRLPGQYLDEEAGRHYNFNRDYMPSVGRYIQSDIIGLGGGINMFIYSYSNPLGESDSRGEQSEKDKKVEDGKKKIIDNIKAHACEEGCDWVYNRCRDTWQRFCVAFGRSTICMEFCELRVPDLCQQARQERCPDVACMKGNQNNV